jgi:hypothetical protein
MTANEARELMYKATAREDEPTKTFLASWYAAIQRAANEGRTSVLASEIVWPEAMARQESHAAGFDCLQRAGFLVQVVPNDEGVGIIKVSW